MSSPIDGALTPRSVETAPWAVFSFRHLPRVSWRPRFQLRSLPRVRDRSQPDLTTRHKARSHPKNRSGPRRLWDCEDSCTALHCIYGNIFCSKRSFSGAWKGQNLEDPNRMIFTKSTFSQEITAVKNLSPMILCCYVEVAI